MKKDTKIEQLFELSNYDSKNITNKGSKAIPQAALEKIENEGATLEFLNELNIPVFKYRTQITIHGIFPELKKNYLGGYKNLFQNKNLSIGVKWNAVDYSKKQKIYDTIKNYLPDWNKRYNSQEFLVFKLSKSFNTKPEYLQHLEVAKNEIAHIDKNLFFGNLGIYLQPQIWGGYHLVTYLNIGGILDKNVTPLIENVCKATTAQIEAKFEAIKKANEKAETERKAAYEIAMAERKAKQAPLLEAAAKILTDAGYILQNSIPITNESVFVKISTDTETGRFYFVAQKFTKEQKQKKFRYVKATSNDLIFAFSENSYNKQETIQTTCTGYILPISQPQAAKETKQITPQQKNVIPQQQTAKIEIVQYSEKAIAIFGDTKTVKEQLKSIGAKFNPYLNHNGTKAAGWIMPNCKMEQAKLLCA